MTRRVGDRDRSRRGTHQRGDSLPRTRRGISRGALVLYWLFTAVVIVVVVASLKKH